MPRTPLTPEQKERMAEGRRLAAQRKREAKEVAEAAAELIAEQAAPPALDREALRAKWTQGIPADVAALISDEELQRMQAEEDAKAVEERKKRALEAIRAQMRHEARVENALIDASTLRSQEERAWLMQKGRVRINVPLDGSGDPARSPAGFRVDGRWFTNGLEYDMTRAEFISLHANHYGVWLHQLRHTMLNQTDGESARAVLARQIPEFEFRPL